MSDDGGVMLAPQPPSPKVLGSSPDVGGVGVPVGIARVGIVGGKSTSTPLLARINSRVTRGDFSVAGQQMHAPSAAPDRMRPSRPPVAAS